MNWSSHLGGDDKATDQITATGNRGSVLWNIASFMLSEEEILDLVFYVKEATNAYTIEITWALVLVLGGTCLYIYRLLGQQEAARVHLHRANCRPVFSTRPAANSPFLLAYKNRFAHKDTKKQAEESNTVGYDVLHRYNKSTSENCLVPKAVWKRHSSGPELESTDPQHQGGDRNRPLNVKATINNRSYSMPKRPFKQSQQPGLHQPLVNVTSRNTVVPQQPKIRSVPLEVNKSKYQQLPKTINKQEIVADQFKHPSPQPIRPPRKPSPSPPQPPVPAPRSDEKVIKTAGQCVGREKGPIAKPRKKSLSPAIKNKLDIASKKLSKEKIATGGGKKTTKYVESISDSETSSDSSAKDSRPIEVTLTKKRKSATKQTKPDIKQMIKNAKRIPRKTHSNNTESTNTKKSNYTNTSSENIKSGSLLETMDSEMESKESKFTLPDAPHHLDILRSHAELEMLDRLRKKLLSEGNILGRYQTASAFLDKVSQLYTVSRLHQMHQASDTDTKSHSMDQTEICSDESYKTHVDNPAPCSDESYKTHVDNPAPGGKSESTNKLSLPVSDKASDVDLKKIDSSVLRAVQAEHKSMQDEKEVELLKKNPIQKFTDGLAKDNNETALKMASGMDESEKEDAIYECERRLAHLRMRMESRLAKIPSPPNPENMIVNKLWSVTDDHISERGDIVEQNQHAEADMFTSRHAKKELDVSEKNIPKPVITANHSFQRPEIEKLNYVRALVTASNPTNNAIFTEATRVTSFLEVDDSSRCHSKTVVTVPSEELSTQECNIAMSTPQENTISAGEPMSEKDNSCSKVALSEVKVLAWKEKLLNEESLEEMPECQKTGQENLKIKQSSSSEANEFNSKLSEITHKLSTTDLMKSLQKIIHLRTDSSNSVKDTPASIQRSDEVKAEHHTINVKEPQNTIHLTENESQPNEADKPINNIPQISPREIKKIIFSGCSVNSAIKSPMPYTSIDSKSKKSIATCEPQLVQADKSLPALKWESSFPRIPQVSPPAHPKTTSAASGTDSALQTLCGEQLKSVISKFDKPSLKKQIESHVDRADNEQKAHPKFKAFNIFINNRKMALAGGESVLAKQAITVNQETAGICEESTLTPSMANKIFDPKMLRERELEKQKVDRVARTTSLSRLGLSTNQLRANISLFEKGPTVPSQNSSNVKACVQMFENRSVSLSPERRKRYTVRLSGSPPTPIFSLP